MSKLEILKALPTPNDVRQALSQVAQQLNSLEQSNTSMQSQLNSLEQSNTSMQSQLNSMKESQVKILGHLERLVSALPPLKTEKSGPPSQPRLASSAQVTAIPVKVWQAKPSIFGK